MTEKKLRENVMYLINKYIPEKERGYFYELISRDDVPVKGILADFNKIKKLLLKKKMVI
ncbi:hypothetical protein ACVW06_003654 [Pantoea ananatis]